jgi:polysaccharide biosynthesis protein VpsQ
MRFCLFGLLQRLDFCHGLGFFQGCGFLRFWGAKGCRSRFLAIASLRATLRPMIPKVLALACIGFVVVMTLQANQKALPPLAVWVTTLPMGDTVGHFLSMGMLSFLTQWAWGAPVIFDRGKGGRSWEIPNLSLVVLVLVTLEELSQGMIPSRTLSWSDWIADVVGIGLGGWYALALNHRHPKTPD